MLRKVAYTFSMRNSFIIKDDFVNTRLDKWIRKVVFDAPQSFIEKNLRKGKIKVNNKKNKSSYKLKKDDLVTFFNLNFIKKNKQKQKKYIPTKKDLSFSSKIFIENNENFAVVNKPAGIAVQMGTKSRKNILDILKSTNEFSNSTPFTVHRIDKETTGILIVAKNRRYAQLFTSLFRIRKIHKTYLCIVFGEVKELNGTFIDTLEYIEKNKKVLLKAITDYQLLDSNNNYSLLKLIPKTGRKHQLRRQLFLRGHPVIGDQKYKILGKNLGKKNPLMLHAYKISFSINNIKYNFLADPPEKFKNYLEEKYLKIYQK